MYLVAFRQSAGRALVSEDLPEVALRARHVACKERSQHHEHHDHEEHHEHKE